MTRTSEKTVLVLGASSDIGKALMRAYLDRGCRVIGTYRNQASLSDFPAHPRATLFQCDVGSPVSILQAAERFRELGQCWDIFISGVGTEEPIGGFFETDFNDWEKSVIVNSTAQLRYLHAVYASRRPGSPCHAAFFAGGGTNNAFPNYSAYCTSKIMLIKMCELLHTEARDLNAFIVGPGWVRTKIHDQTLQSGGNAGGNLRRTREFLDSGDQGTPMEDIFACIEWCIAQGRDIAGGRNFSVVHDPWKCDGKALSERLGQDQNKFRLRRSGNEDSGIRQVPGSSAASKIEEMELLTPKGSGG